MKLDPDTSLVLELMRAAGRPAFETLTPDEARAAYAASRDALQPAPDLVGDVRDFAATGPAGDIPLRCYRPLETTAAESLPGLIYYHGGGWLLGGLDLHDVVCRRLANLARCNVVSVDYRVAPEHKFPAAVEDCAVAVRWVIGNAESLSIDPARLAVGGDLAGGNLAAVMALMARDGGVAAARLPASDLSRRGHDDDHGFVTDGSGRRAADLGHHEVVYRPLYAQPGRSGGLARLAAAGAGPVRRAARPGSDRKP